MNFNNDQCYLDISSHVSKKLSLKHRRDVDWCSSHFQLYSNHQTYWGGGCYTKLATKSPGFR
jgi:hypothetical protein